MRRHNEVQPGEDRRETGDDDADQRGNDVVMGRLGAVRRIKGPARVDAAGEHGVHRPGAAEHEQVPARQVDARESEVLGPDHERQAEIAEHGRYHRHEKKEDHDHAVHRE